MGERERERGKEKGREIWMRMERVVGEDGGEEKERSRRRMMWGRSEGVEKVYTLHNGLYDKSQNKTV